MTTESVSNESEGSVDASRRSVTTVPKRMRCSKRFVSSCVARSFRETILRRLIAVLALSLSLMGCWGPKQPLNPPRLVLAEPTDTAIQLYIQATILLSAYYHLDPASYATIRQQSASAGFSALPFMPPETARAVPLNLLQQADMGNATALADYVVQRFGYKLLVKYYIRTGLRASQVICRNYLTTLDENDQYLEFLRKEFGVAYGLTAGIFALTDVSSLAANTLTISRTAIDQGASIYEDYRFLSIDRESARVLVETAQNKYAQLYLNQVDLATLDQSDTTGGYTFADALNAVSVIEYQCTREGIRSLLNKSINNTPSNLEVDATTGQLIFKSNSLTQPAAGTPVPPTPQPPPPPVNPTPVPAPVHSNNPPPATGKSGPGDGTKPDQSGQQQAQTIQQAIDNATKVITQLQTAARGPQATDKTRAQAKTQIDLQINILNGKVAGAISVLPDSATRLKLQSELDTLSKLVGHELDTSPDPADKPPNTPNNGN